MNTTKVKIKGVTPLIMHSGRLADPIDPATLALSKLTSKKTKTVEDHKAISKCEWHGSLYVDENEKPCLPGEVIEACLVDGAKRYKLGKAAKGGIIVAGNYALKFDGPKTIEKLWENGGYLKRAGVRVGNSRVIRSRPIFPEWSVEFEVMWDPDFIKDKDQLFDIVASAGQAGMCDWRPKYGRFEVV